MFSIIISGAVVAILLVTGMIGTLYALDLWFTPVNTTTGRVTRREIEETGYVYDTGDITDEPTVLPVRYVSIEVEDPLMVLRRSVGREFYELARVGDAVCIEYQRGRLTGRRRIRNVYLGESSLGLSA